MEKLLNDALQEKIKFSIKDFFSSKFDQIHRKLMI